MLNFRAILTYESTSQPAPLAIKSMVTIITAISVVISI
jgi:hypothetical protein